MPIAGLIAFALGLYGTYNFGILLAWENRASVLRSGVLMAACYGGAIILFIQTVRSLTP